MVTELVKKCPNSMQIWPWAAIIYRYTTGCSRWIGDILKMLLCGFIFRARHFFPSFLSVHFDTWNISFLNVPNPSWTPCTTYENGGDFLTPTCLSFQRGDPLNLTSSCCLLRYYVQRSLKKNYDSRPSCLIQWIISRT